MDDVWEPYMMVVTRPTGGRKNILRYDGTNDDGGDDTVTVDDSGVLAPIQDDEGGGMAGAVDGGGDVRVRIPDRDAQIAE